VKKITFCGDDGDPVYAREFIEIVEFVKVLSPSVQIVIVTNGSYKTPNWWSRLSNLLTASDNIHFSLDGWDQDSNEIYRVNCDWDSIMQGIGSIDREDDSVFLTWAAIAFRFNEYKIDRMRQMARDLKFDYFQLTHSTKFGSNYSAYPKDDPLEPSNRFVARGRFSRKIENISNRQWNDRCIDTFTDRYKNLKSIGDILPLCSVGNKGLYINSQGTFYPCCWTGLRYQHNDNIFDYVDQKNKTIAQILDDPNWSKLFDSMKDDSCPNECREKCNTKLWTLEHATSW
jgi:MoaA/NifB/PqqE/SkfB family radical SAM enzyme